mmetsp:Transcript_38972/g.102729  ORF Transcript_38972/g.102729 Transcript_38972/m.102729 type:complete len:116 (+) Transcript_38972:87-434(+)
MFASVVVIVCGAQQQMNDKSSAVAGLTPAELAHKRHFIWSIGEGFEGTASDWTEYVVWLLGLIGVLYYMANPNARRNLHAVDNDDEQDGNQNRFEVMDHHDELFDVTEDNRKKDE